MCLLSVVIPTMNEAESVGRVLDELHRSLEGIDHEVLIVDTDSHDRTREIAAERGARVISESRRGYGRAYKTGFSEARGEYILTMDADCTYPIDAVMPMLERIQEGDLDFISGNRFADLREGSMRLLHRFGNRLLTLSANILFRVGLRDSQSGMWLFRRDCLEKLDLRSDGMPFSEEIKIEAHLHLRFLEIPISYHPRVGDVKLLSWQDGFGNLTYLWKKRLGL